MTVYTVPSCTAKVGIGKKYQRNVLILQVQYEFYCIPCKTPESLYDTNYIKLLSAQNLLNIL